MASSREQSVAEAVDVVLRDGGTLRLRAPLAADGDALLAFFEGLSDQSRYLRFHGFRRIEPALVEPLLDPDWFERGALAGWFAGRDREERVVAVGSYTRLGGSETRPRWRSPSTIPSRDAGSAPACSSDSPPGRATPASTGSSPR